MLLEVQLPSEKAYAFVTLIDTAKLTSIRIVRTYTFTRDLKSEVYPTAMPT